jgi:hypothetical protein
MLLVQGAHSEEQDFTMRLLKKLCKKDPQPLKKKKS